MALTLGLMALAYSLMYINELGVYDIHQQKPLNLNGIVVSNAH